MSNIVAFVDINYSNLTINYIVKEVVADVSYKNSINPLGILYLFKEL